jgi:ankyrin repeat protein
LVALANQLSLNLRTNFHSACELTFAQLLRRYGHVRAAALLLDLGADVDAVDFSGQTALQIGAEYKRRGIVMLLKPYR